MSRRGGGGGRRNEQRQPPSPAVPSSSTPRGRGGRRGGRSTSQSISEIGSSSSTPSPSTLSRDLEQRLTLQSPVPEAEAPSVPEQPPPASSKSVQFPARPGYGTIGIKCFVRANHFLVQLEEKDLHHYDVSITPEVPSKGLNRVIMKQLIELYRESHLGKRKPVYDGRKSLYTAGPLPFTSKEFAVTLADKVDNGKKTKSPRKERVFKVAIKFASKPDIHHLKQFLQTRQRDAPQETIQALDVVLREFPSREYTVVGRSFFSLKFGERSEIGDGLECWRGYYQSLRPTQMGMSLNIDVSATSFYEAIPVIEFIHKFLNLNPSRPLSDSDRVKVKKALRGIKVEVSHSSKRYKISGITAQSTGQLVFPIDDQGGKMSVLQYFKERYGITLRCTNWPSLQAGSEAKPAYLPIELCKITEGQRYLKKLNEKQVAAILQMTCKRPAERERSIVQTVRRNEYTRDEFVVEFGMKVDDAPVTTPARVLPPPVLKYHDTGREVKIQPRVGQWNMINTKMVNGSTVDNWTCISFSNRMRQDMAFQFFDELIDMCASKGMVFSQRPIIDYRCARPEHIERALTDIFTQSTKRLETTGAKIKQLQLLIIILPDFTGSYGRIKKICETELGIVSQCCKPNQAAKFSKQYLENVSLKINVKTGGRNNVLMDAIQRRIPLVSDAPTIIFGADVTHPPPGEDSNPSIAAVVASMDWPEITKYKGLVSAQTHRQEIIEDLFKVVQDPQRGSVSGGIIRELLISFRKSTGHKPHRIIFYRDGVSEGQFNQVLLHEMEAIRKACASLEVGYLPPVTFVVVQKRHHTRLFPKDHNNRDLTDKSGNILPGTVVDTTICHPTEFDFYLCSHAGIKGTSRPTHYHVLWDENKFSADQLQMLTNNLCYTYARCTRSVSIVPPAYYAHLAAFRARYYIEDTSDGGSSSIGGAGGTRERIASVRPLPQIKENVKEVMFYC